MPNATSFQTVRSALVGVEEVSAASGASAHLRRYGVDDPGVTFRDFGRTVPEPSPVVTITGGLAALGQTTPLAEAAVRLTFVALEPALLFAALWQREWGNAWGDVSVSEIPDLLLPVEPVAPVRELVESALRLHTLYTVIPPMEAIQREPEWLAKMNHRSVVPIATIPWLEWKPLVGETEGVTVDWPPGLEPPAEPLDEHGDDDEAAECAPVPGGITIRAPQGVFTVPSVPAARYLAWVLACGNGSGEGLKMPGTTEDCWHVLEDKDHQMAHLLAFQRRRDATEKFINEMAVWLMGEG